LPAEWADSPPPHPEVEDCTFTFGMNASCEVDQIDERAKSSRHTFGVLGAIKTKLEAITFEWRAEEQQSIVNILHDLVVVSVWSRWWHTHLM